MQRPFDLRRVFGGKTAYQASEAVSQLLNQIAQLGNRWQQKIKTDNPTEIADVLSAVHHLDGRASDILIFDLGKRYSNRLMLEDGRLIGSALFRTPGLPERTRNDLTNLGLATLSELDEVWRSSRSTADALRVGYALAVAPAII